jgi:hypothetical protein
MLDKLTKELFIKRIGESFYIDSGDNTIVLRLMEVSALGSTASLDQERQPGEGLRLAPFSILFHGPHEPALGQGMYAISNEQIGALEALFLVPVGADKDGRIYEAVFN